MRKFLGVVAGVFAVLLFASSSALAAPKNANPFNGTYRGTTTVAATGDPSVFSTTSQGTLNANQLGNGTYTILATQTWGLSSNCGASPIQAVVSNGSATLSAGKSGSISGTITGTVCELPPFDNTTYASTLTMTITSGTGKFAGSTGTVALNGTETGPAGGPFNDVATMVGTISK